MNYPWTSKQRQKALREKREQQAESVDIRAAFSFVQEGQDPSLVLQALVEASKSSMDLASTIAQEKSKRDQAHRAHQSDLYDRSNTNFKYSMLQGVESAKPAAKAALKYGSLAIPAPFGSAVSPLLNKAASKISSPHPVLSQDEILRSGKTVQQYTNERTRAMHQKAHDFLYGLKTKAKSVYKDERGGADSQGATQRFLGAILR